MEATPSAVTVERIGKHYLLGQRDPYKTLRNTLANMPRRISRPRPDTNEGNRPSLWALRDVSFDLRHGEALGVIGHNGAGKSTLLKILARVTAPTEGRATLHGRAAALLEVGTGFHPELTGRENVFLNGSVLGMRQAEIRDKFDRIVDFAEMGQFIDTPTKRYSSGMQVRLAFAIAAFLEPDILIVDEVLAVGDVAFQRRCLGKLGAGSVEGRTVLFVSHNLPAIRALCRRSILLDHGTLVFDGSTDEAINQYLSTKMGPSDSWDLAQAERPAIEMAGRARLKKAVMTGASEAGTIGVGGPITVRIEFEVSAPIEDMFFVLNLSTLEDVLVAQSVTTNVYPPVPKVEPGGYTIEARLEAAPLQPGSYSFGFGVRSSAGLEDQVTSTGMVEFVESVDLEFPWFGGPGGYLRLPVEWSPIRAADGGVAPVPSQQTIRTRTELHIHD
jgi:lipopolysaccharide transport system ATP-binding protein